jgi:hypothetical protein
MKIRVRKWRENIMVDTRNSVHSILWINEGCLSLGYWRDNRVKIIGMDLVECYGL